MPSSVIQSHHYDPEREELSITFTTGRSYVYFHVPPEAYEDFRDAFSKGRHFNAKIRDSYDFAEAAAQPTDS
ncbi:MAG TPA: KTSC domain-containing protein [Allosphingosinicella sp.]|nr:KTSC domain-containing protein [Allosphingosinicella sp.]